jgi:signal transduction histidine kinase
MTVDPAELQRAEQALAEARRRTDALAFFARRMTHDLSNFLTVIRTYSELVLADTPPDSPIRPDLEEIGQAADATVQYMQRASAFGRALYPPATPSAPMPLDGFVIAVVAQASASGLGSIDVQATSDAHVAVPAPALAEAVQELLRNARAASPADTTVSVRTRVAQLDAPIVDGTVPVGAGTWAVIEIVDRGPGIAPEVAESACDPFVTSQSGVRGAGLGLAIARATAWAANGQLVLTREGSETVARLYLPVS